MDFNILILGSGAATPSVGRHCSGQLVTICGQRLLIDCGESTQGQLRKYHQRIQTIKAIFISHLHGDHFFGLPGLLSTMHLNGRKEPLTVYAPKGARQAIELLFDVSGTHLDYELTINELDFEVPTVIRQEAAYHVTAFPLRHTVPTYGFVLAEEIPLLNLRPMMRDRYQMTNDQCINVKKGMDLTLPDGTVIPCAELTYPRRRPRSYAYCCDTVYDEAIVPLLKDVDLLCMESTFASDNSELAAQRCHCTAAQAATIASHANADRLLLTHFSKRYRELDQLLNEATAIFPNTSCANDGQTYQIPYKN